MAEVAQTPEAVALDLFGKIATAEHRHFTGNPQSAQVSGTLADRKWILDTYAQCLNATKGMHDWTS